MTKDKVQKSSNSECYQMSYKIAQNKKPQTITETVILPAATDMVQTMFGEECAL
jgi:hypothetical protein